MSGKTISSATMTTITMKNGRAARASYSRSRPVSDWITNRLSPIGGVICDISTTTTM
jgi:hypothetical protein